jgi:hypothetical protein
LSARVLAALRSVSSSRRERALITLDGGAVDILAS